MDQLDLNSTEAEGLVDSLNILLDNLDIPIELESPYDLTPSLLLAILESTLESRLPLSDKLRQAQSPQSKVEAVKVFLGVLGNDVLKIDLSSIDPRRLARGEWDEVVYMGYLLVRVAKRVGMLEPERFNIVDLEPDAAPSQHESELKSLQSFSPPLSSTPPPLREPLPPTRLSLTNHAILSQQALSRSASAVKPTKGDRRNPRPPERQSTPPHSGNRELSYMVYRPLASPPKATNTPVAELSMCFCSFEEDSTRSTVHCGCEIHGPEGSHSETDLSFDCIQSRRRNLKSTVVDIPIRQDPSRPRRRTSQARY